MSSVLVTGASTGIGRATALRLDGGGWRVFAGVRREEDAASLREAGSERLEPLMLDVTDAGQIAAAAEHVGEAVGETGLDGLVNNAGIGVPGPLETLPVEDFRAPDRGQPDGARGGDAGDAAGDPRGRAGGSSSSPRSAA